MSSKLISLWNFKISVVPARYNGYFKSTSFDGDINLIVEKKLAAQYFFSEPILIIIFMK